MSYICSYSSGGEAEGEEGAERTYMCDACGIRCSNQNQFQRHMTRRHSARNPISPSYHCQFCSFSSILRSNLVRHMALHTSSRSFVCELCGASFYTSSTLKEHYTYVHSKERSHACEKCGKKFKVRNALLRHLSSHSNTRPFRCHTCPQGYKRLSHLRRHVRSCHNQDLPSTRVVQRLEPDGEGNLVPVAKSSLRPSKAAIHEELVLDENPGYNGAVMESHLVTVIQTGSIATFENEAGQQSIVVLPIQVSTEGLPPPPPYPNASISEDPQAFSNVFPVSSEVTTLEPLFSADGVYRVVSQNVEASTLDHAE